MFDELIFFMMGGGFQNHFTTYFQIGSFLILTKQIQSPNFQINIDIAYFQRLHQS